MKAKPSNTRSIRVILAGFVVALFFAGCGRAAITAPMESGASVADPRAEPAPAQGVSVANESRLEASADVKAESKDSGLANVAPSAFRGSPAKSMDSAPVGQMHGKPAASTQRTSAAKVPSGNSEMSAGKLVRAPLLIYKADIILAVFEVNKGLDAVEKIARDAEGYLVMRRDDSITVRVPAAGFDSSLQAVLKLGDILQRNLQVDDVTAQMNDLATRLRNAEAMRDRLEQLLKAANTTDDALKVEEQLGRVTGDIESLKGKIRLMSELVAFSTMTVSFRPAAVTGKVNSKFKLPFPWLDDLGLSRLLSL